MNFDLHEMKSRFPSDVYSLMKERKQVVLRIVKEISVLDYAQDGKEYEDDKHRGKGRRKNSEDFDNDFHGDDHTGNRSRKGKRH
jgi:hypothetical protein